MDKRKGGWTNSKTDKQMDGQMDIFSDRLIDRHKVTDRDMQIEMDGQNKDRKMDSETHRDRQIGS